MSSGYGEKEREFLASLKADTGRDLEEWMAAIAEQNFAHRNDIIDWMRQQGFMFSKASWLERIYHNGGRPIYADELASQRPAQRSSRLTAPATRSAAEATVEPTGQNQSASRASANTAASPAALDELISTAKAYRPLAQFVLAEITRAVPGSILSIDRNTVQISGRAGLAPFAILVIGARDLRLALALGERASVEGWQAAKFSPPPPAQSGAMSHMVVLTDARQVDGNLLNLVREAALR